MHLLFFLHECYQLSTHMQLNPDKNNQLTDVHCRGEKSAKGRMDVIIILSAGSIRLITFKLLCINTAG